MWLSLLFFAAALCLWQAGDRRASSRGAQAVPSVRSVGSDRSVPSASPAAPSVPAPAAAARSYRLSNTPESAAQLQRNPRAILLRNATIDTARPVQLAIPEPLRAHGPPGSYLVQSDRPLNQEFYAALTRDGAEFVSYIPNNTALVRATPEAARTMVADRVFQAVLPYEPYYKLDGSLLPAAVNGGAAANNELRVTVFPGQDAAAARGLAALGANVTGQEPAPFGATTFLVMAAANQLAAVAQLPQAQEIESYSPRHKLDDLGRVTLGVAADTSALTNYQGLMGSNIWLVLDDTGVDGTHPDFGPASRLAGLTTDTDGHGTAVAGVMIGGGNKSLTVTNFIPGSTTPGTNLFRGMAPQASLYVQGVDLFSGPLVSDSWLQSNASYVLTAMAATNAALRLTNGFINNISWGYQSTFYDLSAAGYDLATRNAQPGAPGEHAMLFVVAAGNGGGAAGSITSPGTMKNGITVGAMNSPRFITNTVDFTNEGITGDPIFQSTTFDSNHVVNFSSGGNVGQGLESPGGRFKPDVVAPGAFIITTRAANYQDPAEQQAVIYNDFPGQSVLPGQSNVYQVNISGGTTNLILQVLPDAFSPVPFPTNLQIYFDNNDPPRTLITATNGAGLPVAANPAAGDGYVEVFSPASQPWPVAYELRVYGIQTNNDYDNYYQVLSNQLNANLLPWYRYESGTSMAAGAVSGMLALAQEYLNSKLSLTPSPALLKALAINGSRPLNRQSDLNPAPGLNLEGYGQPNLTNCIPTNMSNGNAATASTGSMVVYDQSPSNALQTGQWHQYTVTLNAAATNSPLRVTLVWTDPPGNPAAGLALVNDLDLVVTDSTGSNVYVGNDFNAGDIYTEASADPANPDPSDTVNNVENVYLDPFGGLAGSYTVSVRGTRVNVNAATMQTNVIGQDYALVISDDDPTSILTVTDGGTTNAATNTALVTVVNNGVALLHQRVGANEPNGDEQPGGLYPAPGSTNGSLVQWHFFKFTNINYQTNQITNTATVFTNSAGANIAAAYTNAVFATFLPPTLTIPISSPVNGSYPAANNADLELYVSTNPALFSLDPGAVAGASKSLGQGGSETVLFTNIASVPVFYAGVKSESQQGGDFAFFAALTTNFDSLDGDNPITVSAFALPVAIPDTDDAEGLEGANAIAFVASPIMVRKVAALVGVLHANPADLYGTLTHAGQTATPNHFTGAPGGFTNFYDDLQDGSVFSTDYPTITSDGPETLLNFVGQTGSGQWILNERDNVLSQTGIVTMLTLTIWPQPPEQNPLYYTNFVDITTNGAYYGYVDVPNDATNLSISISLQSAGPLGIFLTNQETPNSSDYGTNAMNPPGGVLNLSTDRALNLAADPAVSNAPPLSGGRWYYEITNENSTTALTNLPVVIDIEVSATPNLNVTVSSTTTPTPLGTDDHTLSQICVTNGFFSSNQMLAALQVGVRIDDPGADNLVLTLTGPQGTSAQLYDSRGGPLATNLGLTTSDGMVYFTFTDNADLAQQLVKFFPPPFGQLPANVDVIDSGFETNSGDYGQPSAFFPTLGAALEGWTVATNDVAVVTGSGLYPAYEGTNYLALADALMTTTIPTVVGQVYTLTNFYRGPGLVDWWPFDNSTNINDIIGTNNGKLAGGPMATVTGEVNQGLQFPSNSPPAVYAYPRSALEWYNLGHKTNGTYPIDPDGTGVIYVQCNMTASGGGWTELWTAVANSSLNTNPNQAREYLYLQTAPNSGLWYRSPINYDVWNWSQGTDLDGTYYYSSNSGVGSFNVTPSAVHEAFGVGGSSGAAGPECAILDGNGLNPTLATFQLAAVPSIFGATYVQGVTVYMREVPPQPASINFGTNAANFGTNDFTIDYWMNTTSTNAAEAFLQQGSACGGNTNFWDIVTTNGVPSLSVFDTSSGQGPMTLICSRPLRDGLWHHLAWTRNGSNYFLYVDGQLNNNMNAGTNYDLSNGQPLIMGTNSCAPGIQVYTGAVDEFDLWNRALTDVEIAAIYQAGANHIGKATPTSIFPNCEILVNSGTNSITNTLIATNASGANWLTNTLYFTAFNSNTTITLQGNPLGMLLDDFVLQTPADLNYVQPEEPLAPFTGENPFGCWTLDVWDTRTDSSFLTNGTLLSWNLQMTVSSTNVNLIVLTNHVPYTNGLVAAGGIAYFAFDVPAGVNIDTNRLLNGSTNLNLLFSQTALPTGNQLGDYTLLTNVLSGTNVLAANTPPPSLLPGARYFLGVQNTNNVAATFAIEVDTRVLANTNLIIPLANAIARASTITTAPQYYSFFVPTNAILASFEIINPANEVDLYARHALPLPSVTTFDYRTSSQGTNDEAIVVATNYSILGAQISTNSDPVPLTPGTWYLAVYNPFPGIATTYQVVATYITSGGITITPLTDGKATNGTIGPGPDLTHFYSFYVANNTPATGVRFVVSNMTGNVDLIARDGDLPTPQQMTDGSFNPGTNPELITIYTNVLLPSLDGTTWYLGVPNNTAAPVSFTIAAATLTNAGYTFPAVALAGMSVGANGFTLQWTAVPGAQYEVDMSSNLTQWTKAAAVTTGGSTGSYTDPDLQQPARFYIIFRIQ